MRKVYYYVTAGLARITPFGLLSKARNTVGLMKADAAFSGASTTLAAASDAADALEKAIDAYQLNPGPRERSEREGAFAVLKGLMIDLVGIVQTVSNGDRKVIESSGLAVRKNATPTGELAAPAGLIARMNAIPGRVDVRWGGLRGRIFYRLFVCAGDPKDEKNWQLLAQTSKNHFAATELESDKVYYFRVQAQGVAGLTAMSDLANAKAA